jgi:hypothetical protein
LKSELKKNYINKRKKYNTIPVNTFFYECDYIDLEHVFLKKFNFVLLKFNMVFLKIKNIIVIYFDIKKLFKK